MELKDRVTKMLAFADTFLALEEGEKLSIVFAYLESRGQEEGQIVREKMLEACEHSIWQRPVEAVRAWKESDKISNQFRGD